MKSLIFTFVILAQGSLSLANTPLLNCVSGGAVGSKVVSLVLEKKEGTGYLAKMESSFEDGVVEIEIPTAVQTPASTQYVLKRDHDLLMTLATYGSKAVVFYQSTDPLEKAVDIEFLKCEEVGYL